MSKIDKTPNVYGPMLKRMVGERTPPKPKKKTGVELLRSDRPNGRRGKGLKGQLPQSRKFF